MDQKIASRQRRIGIALSGGAARGLAHVGVLSVLQKADVPIEYVAGCSAGAILGALFCAGMSIEQIRVLTSYVSWCRLARPVQSPQGFWNAG